MTSAIATSGKAKLDQACASAVELAREAILDENVAGHLGVVAEGERVATHHFACTLPGYHGWRWAVTVARASRSKHVTVCETVLLPGDEALLAPAWVPWNERLQPGDLGVGDLLPTPADDLRLAPGYVLSDDPGVEEVSWELGLGRPRVMSRDGRAEAAQRWYDGDHGPEAAISVGAPTNARCGLCGFYLPLAGSLRQVFGVCGNMFAPDDGRVVSADHGCGAHSEVLIEASAPVDEVPSIYDDSEIEAVSMGDSTLDDSAAAASTAADSAAGDATAIDSFAAGSTAAGSTAADEAVPVDEVSEPAAAVRTVDDDEVLDDEADRPSFTMTEDDAIEDDDAVPYAGGVVRARGAAPAAAVDDDDDRFSGYRETADDVSDYGHN